MLNKRSFLLFTGGILLFAMCALVLFFVSETNVPIEMKELPRQKSSRVRSHLDGVFKTADTTNDLIYAVMIDNHNAARQYHRGLQEASVYYEALAEGGITRIMAVFDGSIAGPVGPVRSLRDYFLDFAEEHRAILIHAGGSPTAIARVARDSLVKDIDGLAYEEIGEGGRGGDLGGSSSVPVFFRDGKIQKPHNFFVELSRLKNLIGEWSRENGKENNEPFFLFADSAIGGAAATVEKISLNFSLPAYAVDFKYDWSIGNYRRFVGGKPHLDSSTQEQLYGDNVIVQFVPYYVQPDGRLKMETVGSGKALLFRDGVMISGAWKKDGFDYRTKFFDEAGSEFVLKPGKTWIEVIDEEWRVGAE